MSSIDSVGRLVVSVRNVYGNTICQDRRNKDATQ